MIRLALNQKSCDNLTLLEFIKVSKRFEGVELNFKKVKETLNERIKFKDILDLLEIYDLKITSFFRLKDFSLSSDYNFKNIILPKLREMTTYCYKLEGNLIVVNPSVLSSEISEPRWRIINRTRKRLQIISKEVREYDIKIGFENLYDSSISKLSDAKEVIKPLNEYIENIGYILDSFHLKTFLSPFTNTQFNVLEDIRQNIYLVQLCDLKFASLKELSVLKESDRIFPGKGNLELKGFLKYIKKIGYRNYFSIELYKTNCSKYNYNNFFEIFKNV